MKLYNLFSEEILQFAQRKKAVEKNCWPRCTRTPIEFGVQVGRGSGAQRDC